MELGIVHGAHQIIQYLEHEVLMNSCSTQHGFASMADLVVRFRITADAVVHPVPALERPVGW